MLRASLRADDFLVATSPAMRAVAEQVEAYADGGAPVLITGEHGTGRELVARVLHQRGPRGKSHFITVRPTFESSDLQKVEGDDTKQMQGYKERADIREVQGTRVARELVLEPRP